MPPSAQPPTRLTGIARLAAAGALLAAKQRVTYRELPTRRYINRCESARVPFAWTINPYRGCEFACKYCYARYTHEFMELRDSQAFETQIFAKQWNPAAFREELRRIPKRDWIAIGTATDPYQPAERRFGLTRQILSLFAADRGRRLSLTTKSDLVIRDVPLLAAIASSNVLHVAVTVTTADERLARLLEPYAPRPSLRLGAVAALRKAGIQAGVLCAPVLPGINDSLESLDAVASAAAAAGAVSLSGNVVFLKPCARAVFLPFLEEHFPELARQYRRRFESSDFLRGAYPQRIRQRLAAVRARHGLAERFPDYVPEHWAEEGQLSLGWESLPAGDHFSSESTC
jgi:DNA repair photolyase